MRDFRDVVDAHVASAAGHRAGLAAWAAVLSWDGNVRVDSGVRDQTTGSAAALLAVIEAIRPLNRPVEIVVHTPDTPVFNGAKHLDTWERHKWARRDLVKGKWIGVPNAALWKEFLRVARDGGHRVSWVHAEDPATRCDLDDLAAATAEQALAKARRTVGGQMEFFDDAPAAPAPR
jgi:ribonuclease HI